MNSNTVIAVIFIIALVVAPLHAQPEEGVVQIFTEYNLTKSTGAGSGFFIRIDNFSYIVTCFHVLEGADKVTIVDSAKNRYRSDEKVSDELGICFLDAQHDIAILKLLKQVDGLHYLDLDEKALKLDSARPGGAAWPDAGKEVVLIGHPQFIPYLQLSGRIIRSTFLRSEEFKTIQGLKIFSDEPIIDLLAIDTTIGAGMSGGPVLLNNKVVGIASGSIQKETVGTIGWAIPVKEIRKFVEDKDNFPLMSLQGFKWPVQTLIAAGWTKSRHIRNPDQARSVKSLRDIFANRNASTHALEIDHEKAMLDENRLIRMVGRITHISKVPGDVGGLPSRRLTINAEGDDGNELGIIVSLEVPENYLPDTLSEPQEEPRDYGRVEFSGELSVTPLAMGAFIKLYVNALSLDDLDDGVEPRGITDSQVKSGIE
ncbi:S1 family peptidase [Blastopirellula marina]|uniref:Probable serine proteinase Do n=1 Tax=Blastopirellula marina DSM 3645 TaxID=314230 RepID=A4A237_9BACT|nr:serine protease [Blastopirellula marina]EAQ77140.1 probable serine proteinase Do [Blastopirellula marina DSM 3645]